MSVNSINGFWAIRNDEFAVTKQTTNEPLELSGASGGVNATKVCHIQMRSMTDAV